MKFDFQIACVCMCLLYLVRESWDWELSLCCLFTQGIDISRAFNLVLYNVHHWRKTYKYRLVYGLDPGVWNRNLKHFTLKSCITASGPSCYVSLSLLCFVKAHLEKITRAFKKLFWSSAQSAKKSFLMLIWKF